MLVIKNPSAYNYGETNFKKKSEHIFPPVHVTPTEPRASRVTLTRPRSATTPP